MAAERLGITKTIPAYLDPNLKNEDCFKGINFASGGSGYDPLTAKIVIFLYNFGFLIKILVRSSTFIVVWLIFFFLGRRFRKWYP